MPSTPDPVIAEPRDCGQEYDTPRKAQIRTLKACTNLSNAEIFRRAKVPPRTGYRILKTDSSRRDGKFRPGRPPKIDRDTIEKMVKHITGRYSKRILGWEELGQECGIDASSRTIRRAMHSIGYSKCRACQKAYISPENIEKRRIFAEEHGSWQMDRWKQVEFYLFT